jgi:hypothetical protein
MSWTSISLRGAAALGLIMASSRVAAGQDAVARIKDEPEKNRLVISIGPVDLPAMIMPPGMHMEHSEHMMVLPPVQTVTVPIDASLYGFGFDVVDVDGKPVPSKVVHHLNLIDPGHRELFLPISQRIGAVGGETGSQGIPGAMKYLVGVPVSRGEQIVVSIMLHNPTTTDYHGVTVRYYWNYIRRGFLRPLIPLEPFQFDVAFPVGDKSFDLPPGKSSKSYEGKPAVPGRILAIGGHLHELATSLKFEDATENRLIWEGKPYTDESGNVNRLAVGYLYRRLGEKLYPSHSYRVTVSYDNTTGDTIHAGGMGVVAGVFWPGAPWPATNAADSLYALDRMHYLRQVQGTYQEILGKLHAQTKLPETAAVKAIRRRGTT